MDDNSISKLIKAKSKLDPSLENTALYDSAINLVEESPP